MSGSPGGQAGYQMGMQNNAFRPQQQSPMGAQFQQPQMNGWQQSAPTYGGLSGPGANSGQINAQSPMQGSFGGGDFGSAPPPGYQQPGMAQSPIFTPPPMRSQQPTQGRVFAGGTNNFNERTGSYNNGNPGMRGLWRG